MILSSQANNSDIFYPLGNRFKTESKLLQAGTKFCFVEACVDYADLICWKSVCPLPHGGSSATARRQNKKMCLGWEETEVTPLRTGTSWNNVVCPLRGLFEPNGGGWEFTMDSLSINLSDCIMCVCKQVLPHGRTKWEKQDLYITFLYALSQNNPC